LQVFGKPLDNGLPPAGGFLTKDYLFTDFPIKPDMFATRGKDRADAGAPNISFGFFEKDEIFFRRNRRYCLSATRRGDSLEWGCFLLLYRLK